jgi:hypothetical protein
VDFSGFVDGIVSFAQNHTVIVIVFGVVLFFCIPQTETVFRPSLPGFLPGGIILHAYQRGSCWFGTEKKNHSRGAKTIR